MNKNTAITSSTENISDKVSDIKEAVFSASTDSFGQIIGFWDDILVAILVLLLGWFSSWAVGKIIIKIGQKLRLGHFSDKLGFNAILKRIGIKSSPSQIIAKFFQAWIITVFLFAASKILHLDPVSEFLDSVINFLPNLLVALFIILFAIRLGDFIGAIVTGTFYITESSSGKMLSMITKNIIIAFGVMASLSQLKIAENLIEILFIGFIAMLSLAGGLAFGLGGKDVVSEILKDIKNKHKDK